MKKKDGSINETHSLSYQMPDYSTLKKFCGSWLTTHKTKDWKMERILADTRREERKKVTSHTLRSPFLLLVLALCPDKVCTCVSAGDACTVAAMSFPFHHLFPTCSHLHPLSKAIKLINNQLPLSSQRWIWKISFTPLAWRSTITPFLCCKN